MRVRELTILTLTVAMLSSIVRAHEPKQGQALDHPINYVAEDSLVLTGKGEAYLHGKGVVEYQDMKLEADYIRAKMDSNLVYASGVEDTIREEVTGKPVFSQGKDSYTADEMTMNLKTQKGFIRNVVTEQGEGYVIADKTKKIDDGTMMIAGGKYTTCDDHDHPHFYMRLTKARMEPGKSIATGPAYLVVGEVPLPIAIPFGYFPFTQKYSSGLIMPTFGDEYERGLYLNGIGYYFAINDYVDLTVTGDIYTKGTWAVRAQSNYRKRYKFNGNMNFEYRTDIRGEKGMPNYSKNSSFSIRWTHSQDQKANPYSNFSASVNYSSSGFNRNNIQNYYKPEINSQNTTSSTINYTQRFPESSWSLSMTASITQRMQDSTLSVTAPSLTVNMSRIYPFKRKKPIGKERWYEKISMSYNGAFNNSITCKENYFFHSNFVKDWNNKITHKIPIQASFNLFKYLNISPSISLEDRMYFQRIDQRWDETTNKLMRDTSTGFYNVFDFNIGLSMSTKLYGFYIPYRKWFGDKVDRFRHVLTPTLSVNYHPNFGKKFWGYYSSYDQPVLVLSQDENGTPIYVQKKDAQGNPVYITHEYSRFTQGNAPNGAVASLNFSLGNNIEVKVRDDKDTTGTNPYKVYSIIDNLTFTGGYNFIADSMRWNTIGVQLRIKIPKVNYTINLATQLDPYMYELNALGQPVRTNKQYWNNKRFPHWNGTQMSFSYTFNNATFKKWFGKDKSGQSSGAGVADSTSTDKKVEHERFKTDNSNFEATAIDWSLSFSYSIQYRENRSKFDYDKMQYKMELTHNLNFNGSLSFGKGWKASFNSSYDFRAKRLAYTSFNVSRDLHCWNMSASFVPFGMYKSYNFHIGVNASMLADLKYDKNSTSSNNKRVDYW